MGLESQRIWRGGCLDRDLLVAYHLGRMPTASLERVAEHLESCHRCMSALESVHGEKDNLLRNLAALSPRHALGGGTEWRDSP